MKKLAVILTSALYAFSTLSAIPLDKDIGEGYFDDFVMGDCDGDGVFAESDLICFEQWLLSGNDSLRNSLAVDFNFDGQLDVFDLCLMRDYYIKENTVYSSATYSSKDNEYTMRFSIETDIANKSVVNVQWIDPDGDYEKADSFTMTGNHFISDGKWIDENLFAGDSYGIYWNENSVTIAFTDGQNDVQREIVLDYPDRIKTVQTNTYEFKNETAPEMIKAEVSALTYGDIEDKVEISESRSWMSQNTTSKVGTAFSVDVDESIKEYTVTLYYDETELRWIPEKNLIVLFYDDNAPIQTMPAIDNAVHDMEKNTITFTSDRDCEFILADNYIKSNDINFSYKIDDITKYESNWERQGNTGDIIKLANKNWAKDNLVKGVLSVGTAEELASAVYYINAWQSLPDKLKMTAPDISIELTADIDLSGLEWKPIIELSEKFNGNGHTIKNMNITSSADEVGFIEKANSASITDVTFENATIISGYNYAKTGIVVGDGGMFRDSVLTNVNVTGNITINKSAHCNNPIAGYGSIELKECTADVLINGEAVKYPQPENVE